MSINRLQVRNNALGNLRGTAAGSNFYQPHDINDSIQDAYNEIVAKTRYLVKSVTCNWLSGKNYYDPINDLGVTDYLGTIAIFDNNSNLWLRDDVTIRDFNRIRRDWETWVGYSQFWAPHSQQRFAVCPALAVGTGSFVLWYYAIAPTLPDDSTSLLLPTDMSVLLQDYVSADLLEFAQEVTKAAPYLSRYGQKLEILSERSHNLAAQQLLLRI